MLVISESGFYSAIVRSNLPKAKPFRKWVTSEVLPSLRKTGVYIMPELMERFHTDSALPARIPAPVITKRIQALFDAADRTDNPAAYRGKIMQQHLGICPTRTAPNTPKIYTAEDMAKEGYTVENGIPYQMVKVRASYGDSPEDFVKAYSLFRQGVKPRDIVKQLDTPESTVYRWINKFKGKDENPDMQAADTNMQADTQAGNQTDEGREE